MTEGPRRLTAGWSYLQLAVLVEQRLLRLALVLADLGAAPGLLGPGVLEGGIRGV